LLGSDRDIWQGLEISKDIVPTCSTMEKAELQACIMGIHRVLIPIHPTFSKLAAFTYIKNCLNSSYMGKSSYMNFEHDDVGFVEEVNEFQDCSYLIEILMLWLMVLLNLVRVVLVWVCALAWLLLACWSWPRMIVKPYPKRCIECHDG